MGKQVHCAFQVADMSVMGILFFPLVCLLLLVCIDILLKLQSIEKRKTSTLAWLRSYSCPPPTVHLIHHHLEVQVLRESFLPPHLLNTKMIPLTSESGFLQTQGRRF